MIGVNWQYGVLVGSAVAILKIVVGPSYVFTSPPVFTTVNDNCTHTQ